MTATTKNVHGIVYYISGLRYSHHKQARYAVALLSHLEAGAPEPVAEDYGVKPRAAARCRDALLRLGAALPTL